MQKYLDTYHIEELVRKNSYAIDTASIQLSRCICGIYESTPNLPALSLPGGELGEVAIALASAYSFGYELSYKGLQDSLKEITGRKDILKSAPGQGHDPYLCPYLHAVIKFPSEYGFDNEAKEQFNELIRYSGISEDRLIIGPKKRKNEEALIILQGSKGLFPRHVFETDYGRWESSVLVYQKTLIDARHKALSKKLIKNEHVKLFNGLNEEYLYEVLSEMTDTHLYETLRRIDPAIPIYSVVFDENDEFKIKKLQ